MGLVRDWLGGFGGRVVAARALVIEVNGVISEHQARLVWGADDDAVINNSDLAFNVTDADSVEPVALNLRAVSRDFVVILSELSAAL